ncbi:MAG TPA: efflux RND transporter permease subunit [Fimbriimonadaceae bacterium]|nr:efflux RND transporter permease subunit [Fimbriimonadaceae bacterium]HRJ95211.1 efflux RND transporter permease subunit [Fimbriimonadaceae bacterium]
MGLTRIAITRPVFILMLMLLAFMMGTIGYRSMRVEQNPEVQFGVVTITTIYPGASPDEVNTLISRKVEEAVSGVNGLLEVLSTSQEGVSVVTAQFNVGTDMNVALNDVRSKVDAIVGQLPREIEKPVINKFDSAGDPVMVLALKSEKYDNQQLRDLADDKLKDKFARIDGVANVTVGGGDIREIQVQVKKDRLLKYKVGILDVQRAIQAASMNVPSGRIVEGEREFSVRVPGDFQTIADIEQVRIQIQDPNRMGAKPTPVQLTDVAVVTDASAERRSLSRLNGSDSVSMSIQKSREGNAIEIAKAAKAMIPALEKQFGIQMVVTRDQSTIIQESLSDLNFTLLFGIFLVTVIVFIFLHNLRGTFIVGLAIPLCIFATFTVLWAAGFTINNMTMLALSLAIGVLVDDAIVVLENIYRHLKMGEDPRTAAINGRGEIGLAAIAITLADVVVFVPIAFMGGIVGQFFRPMALAFVVAVIFSLFVSFTVTPMLASRWYRKGEDMEHPTGRFARAFERGFGRFERGYRRSLEWSLKHRYFVFCSGFVALFSVFMMIGGSFAADIAGAITVGSGPMNVAIGIGVIAFVVSLLRRRVTFKPILGGVLFGLCFPVAAVIGFQWAQWKDAPIFNFQFMPQSDGGRVEVKLELAPGASLEETKKAVERIEAIVARNPNAKYVLSNVGTRSAGWTAADQGTNLGVVGITLNDRAAFMDDLLFWVKHDEKLRRRSDSSIAADMLEALGRIPGVLMTVSATQAQGFGAPIQMSFASDDRDLLLKTVSNIRNRLAQGEIKYVISPQISSNPGKPEIRAIPDRVRLADSDMTTADVAAALRAMYEGDNQTKFRVKGREYDVRVMLDLQDRNDPKIVEQLPVAFRNGNPILLDQVTRLEPGIGVDKIERRNREEEIRVTADLLPGGAAGTVQQQINDWLVKENMIPEGVVKKDLGQADAQNRESTYLFSALLIGLVLVYMLLASLYDNLLYPLIIQLAQPQAFVGALLALMITDKALNIVGFVGIIALVGLVGKNAILLVDYANTLRARGRSRHEALVEAGPVRLRPIMMTTLAIILGMLPVALAIGRGSEFRETIGITIIGGVTLSTLLTLLVIPCSYTIFDDLSLAIGRLFHRHTEPEITEGEEPTAEEVEPAQL